MIIGKNGNEVAFQSRGCHTLSGTLARLCVLALAASFSSLAATPACAQGTVGVGTHMLPTGSGVNVGSSAAAKSPSGDPLLASALARLENAARSSDENRAFEAVSTQTKVPVKTLRQQRFATKLKYGDLLIANSLAARSGQSFDNIVAQRGQTRTWSQLARKLQIDPAWVVVRLTAADASLKKSKSRR